MIHSSGSLLTQHVQTLNLNGSTTKKNANKLDYLYFGERNITPLSYMKQ